MCRRRRSRRSAAHQTCPAHLLRPGRDLPSDHPRAERPTFAPALADRIRGAVNSLANVLLTLAVLPLLIVAAPAIWQLIGDGTLLAILVFVLAGLAVGHLLGGPEPDRASVLALSTACRHPAIALAIASAIFPEERFGGAILLYLIVNLIVTLPYITWQRKHVSAATTAA